MHLYQFYFCQYLRNFGENTAWRICVSNPVNFKLAQVQTIAKDL